MSAPAQVTEAHQAAATEWFMSRPTNVSRQIDNLAQIIADSEAAANSILLRDYHAMEIEFRKATAERDQLRAELAQAEESRKTNAELYTRAMSDAELFRSQRDACHAQFKRVLDVLPARQGGYSGAECIDEFFKLRAEVERLTADRDDWKAKHWKAHDDFHRQFLEMQALTARAERAEACLKTIRGSCDNCTTGDDLRTIAGDYFGNVSRVELENGCICERERKRAEKAEAELAAERARLDFIDKHGFEHKHHETGDHLAYEWTVTTVSEDKDTNLRAVIDAAMKEGA